MTSSSFHLYTVFIFFLFFILRLSKVILLFLYDIYFHIQIHVKSLTFFWYFVWFWFWKILYISLNFLFLFIVLYFLFLSLGLFLLVQIDFCRENVIIRHKFKICMDSKHWIDGKPSFNVGGGGQIMSIIDWPKTKAKIKWEDPKKWLRPDFGFVEWEASTSEIL